MLLHHTKKKPRVAKAGTVAYHDFTKDRHEIGSVEQTEEEYQLSKAQYAASIKMAMINRNVSLRVRELTPKQKYDQFLSSEIHGHDATHAPIDVRLAKDHFEALPRRVGGTEYPDPRSLLPNGDDSYLDDMSVTSNLESVISRYGLLRKRNNTNECRSLCAFIDRIKENAAIRFYAAYHEKDEVTLVFALDSVDRLFAAFVLNGAKHRKTGALFSQITPRATAERPLFVLYYFLFTCECKRPQDAVPVG